MAGCVSCFILPLILFLFHRFIQPIILKYFNPWDKKPIEENGLNNGMDSYNEENKINGLNAKKEQIAGEADVQRLKDD